MTLGNQSGGLSVQQKGYLEGSYALILISADKANQIIPAPTKHKQLMSHKRGLTGGQSGCLSENTPYSL